MGQIKFTQSLILVGLFTIALLGFAINFAADNNAPIDISDDPELSGLYNEQSNLTEFGSQSQDTYSSVIDTSISPGSGAAESVGAFALTPLNAVGTVTNILQVGWIKVFGSGAGFGIFLTTFLGMVVFMIALYVYKTLKGSPD